MRSTDYRLPQVATMLGVSTSRIRQIRIELDLGYKDGSEWRVTKADMKKISRRLKPKK